MAGKITINGDDVKNYIHPTLSSSDSRTKQTALKDHIPTFSSYYYPTGWMHDVFEGHLQHNGSTITVAPDSTRPMKNSVDGTTFVGATKYINNVNGKLYLSDSPNSATGWNVKTSKNKTKMIVMNVLFYAAGGKGGGGAYWFLVGNYGGVGGGGASQALVTFVFQNNSYCKLVADSDSSRTGRLNDSSDESLQAPDLKIYDSGGTLVGTVGGGWSGTANHPRWHQDDYGRAICRFSSTSHQYGGVQFLLERFGNGPYKTYNGNAGNDSYLDSPRMNPYWGNPEGVQVVTYQNSGGRGAGEGQGHGSGGGASHYHGGDGGDTGSGSGGSYGQSGGGGGGAGAPAGGASGGDGTPCGLVFVY